MDFELESRFFFSRSYSNVLLLKSFYLFEKYCESENRNERENKHICVVLFVGSLQILNVSGWAKLKLDSHMGDSDPTD